MQSQQNFTMKHPYQHPYQQTYMLGQVPQQPPSQPPGFLTQPPHQQTSPHQPSAFMMPSSGQQAWPMMSLQAQQTMKDTIQAMTSEFKNLVSKEKTKGKTQCSAIRRHYLHNMQTVFMHVNDIQSELKAFIDQTQQLLQQEDDDDTGTAAGSTLGPSVNPQRTTASSGFQNSVYQQSTQPNELDFLLDGTLDEPIHPANAILLQELEDVRKQNRL